MTQLLLDQIEDKLFGLARSGGEVGLGIRYEIDAGTFSSFDKDVQKDIQAVASSAEYALRMLAKKDAGAHKAVIDDKIETVVVRAGQADAGTRDEEWKKAEDAERAAKRSTKPNDPNYDAIVKSAKYRHYLGVHLDGKTLVLDCKLKNAAYADVGAFDIGDVIKKMIG